MLRARRPFVVRLLLAFLVASALPACSSGKSGVAPEKKASPTTTSVELGVPGGTDGLDFEPVDDGAVVDLRTFGQGGTHILLGVRTVGFGIRAYVTFTVTDETTGTTIDAPPPARGQLFVCDDANVVCDLVPVTLMTGGLFGPDETRDGLPVHVGVSASNDAGAQASDERELLLSSAEL
jgi:hypothetical protein